MPSNPPDPKRTKPSNALSLRIGEGLGGIKAPRPPLFTAVVLLALRPQNPITD
jgi:hypothetical protein